ncbi:MAG: ribosomal protein L10 [halophilic archaeon J07HX5]|jgi:LSU ribosomal protein L10P|nr:MAG: ribosomal protein L10 [halophilic archaeon J07HX5]
MSTQRTTETIPEWKRREVDELAAFLDQYESIGVVDITGIPSRQLQQVRRELHETAELRVARNTLIERALKDASRELETLTEHVTGQVGVIGTNNNPFGLYRRLEESKTSAPINAGETAPNDIVVPEGDTGVDPGPFVGDLQNVGANARIEGGSITVLEESTVLEADGTVSDTLAGVLSELGIEPKEVGLDLRGVFADGITFEPSELELDVEQYRTDLTAAAGDARSLAATSGFPASGAVGLVLATASADAKQLGREATLLEPGVIPDLLSRADGQLRALAAQIDDQEALPEELQGADGAATTAESTDTGEQTTEDDTTASEDNTSADDGEGDDDDDDDDTGDALGAMFG